MGRRIKREVIAAGLLLLSGVGAKAASKDEAWKTDPSFLHTMLVFEMDLEPSATNTWSICKGAFEAVRRLQARSDLGAADRTALDHLAMEYDGRLAPSLRNLRHVVSFTRTDFELTHHGVNVVTWNLRKGRKTTPIYPDRPAGEVDVNGPPQLVDLDSVDEIRGMGFEFAQTARKSLKEGQLLLRTSKVDELSPDVRAAYLDMLKGFESAIAVAAEFVEFDAPQGLMAGAAKSLRDYYEAANKALKPLPEARATAVLAYKRAAAVFAKLEFEFARNSGQARFLHGELDKLGPLTPPKQ